MESPSWFDGVGVGRWAIKMSSAEVVGNWRCSWSWKCLQRKNEWQILGPEHEGPILIVLLAIQVDPGSKSFRSYKIYLQIQNNQPLELFLFLSIQTMKIINYSTALIHNHNNQLRWNFTGEKSLEISNLAR
jgi:hypothetical protein